MLTVGDMQNKTFKKNKIGGYNIEEVDSYLEEIIKSFNEVLQDDLALKDQVKVLNESVQYYRTMESTIQNVLVLADKTAQDTKAAAYEKAEQIRKEAEERSEKMTNLAEERVARIIDQGRQEAYELAQKVEEAKRQYLTYKAQFKQLLQEQANFLNQGDVRIASLQDDLAVAFQRIQEDALPKEKEKSDPSEEEDDGFYTKAYTPIEDH